MALVATYFMRAIVAVLAVVGFIAFSTLATFALGDPWRGLLLALAVAILLAISIAGARRERQ